MRAKFVRKTEEELAQMSTDELNQYILDMRAESEELEKEIKQFKQQTADHRATIKAKQEHTEILKQQNKEMLINRGWGDITEDELNWLMDGNLEKFWHGKYFKREPSQREIKIKYSEEMNKKLDLDKGDPAMENPSGWIDRAGNYYAVAFAEHDKFAREHLIEKYGREKAYEYRQTDRGKIPFFEVLEKKFQWVRIMAWPGVKTEFVMPRKLTHAMKQTLYKYKKMQGGELPFKDPIFQD